MDKDIAPDLARLFGLGLRASESFWQSSPHARGLRCNGAGASGGIKVPNTLWGLNVKPVFDIHDWDYAEGGGPAQRMAADIRMLVNSQLMIGNLTTRRWPFGPVLRWLRGVRANTYFNAVRNHGANAFATSR